MFLYKKDWDRDIGYFYFDALIVYRIQFKEMREIPYLNENLSHAPSFLQSAAPITPLPLTRKRACAPPKSLLPAKSPRSEEHTSELQSRGHLVCRLLLEKKTKQPLNVLS